MLRNYSGLRRRLPAHRAAAMRLRTFMKAPKAGLWCLTGLLGALCAPAYASVQILSTTPTLNSPQVIGTSIVWTVTATDSNPGPLTFRFNVSGPGGSFTLARDFNAGTLGSGIWTSLPFTWTPTQTEGAYQIQVVIKDFTSGDTTSQTERCRVAAVVRGRHARGRADRQPSGGVVQRAFMRRWEFHAGLVSTTVSEPGPGHHELGEMPSPRHHDV